MALFRGMQEYIALVANNITLVFDSGNIVNISGNIFLYPRPILYNYQYFTLKNNRIQINGQDPYILSFNDYGHIKNNKHDLIRKVPE